MTNRMILCIALVVAAWRPAAQAAAVDVEGGLVVCIGAEALESVSNAWKDPGCVIQCLETSDAEVASLRKKVQAAGCYGEVSVAKFDGRRLPYIDNLVSLVVVSRGIEIPGAELLRALAPHGVAVVDGKKTTKPYPEDSSRPPWPNGDTMSW